MKICLTSTGTSLDDEIDEEFGHCAYFLIVDTDTMEVTAVKNEGHDAEVGAGIYAAETVVKLGCQAVITGWVGPHGQNKLAKNNIRIVMDEEGPARAAVEKFIKKYVKK